MTTGLNWPLEHLRRTRTDPSGRSSTRKRPASTPSPRSVELRRQVHAADHPAPHHPPIQTSVSHATTTPPSCASYFSPRPTRAARRRSRRRRAATPSRLHAMRPALPHRSTAISTPVDYACRGLPPQPNHGPNRALGRRLGLLRSRAAAEQGVPASFAAARASKPSMPPDLELAATIRSKPIKSEPPDPDPSTQI